MGHLGAARVNRFGTPDGLVVAPSRREIEVADLRYAEACRAKGWGWQAIAQQLRCNQSDLRRAMGDPTLPPRPAVHRPAPLSLTDRVLIAIGRDGAPGGAAVRAATGLDYDELASPLAHVKRTGLARRSGATGFLTLTPAGLARLDKLTPPGGKA